MTDLIDYINDAEFQNLFVEELGWDRPRDGGRAVSVSIDDTTVKAHEVATARGISVWASPSVPNGRAQRKVDRVVKRKSVERLLIFHDGATQQWKWPQTTDSSGSGTARLVTHEHHVGRDNPALTQRLHLVEITLDEDPNVIEIHQRLRKAFDADEVTSSFYDRFSDQFEDLCNAIEGLAATDESEQSDVRWYASLLMNRLMFIYFIQRKGFLANDRDYLRNRLERVQGLSQPPDTFYEFYKDFLVPLFHEGLGTTADDRRLNDAEIAALIGDIPYINGGIFSVHPLEAANEISIPDNAFESIFDFFDNWRWHLDERPTGHPNEINPDVLGYIFEQFVNRKEQGAYYTKEDVTDYMTSNTLVPAILYRIEQQTGVNPWRLLTDDPDRYIWNSVAYGHERQLHDQIQDESDSWPRPTWDEQAPPGIALPSETWWEVHDRRARLTDLRNQIYRGEVNTPDDAVTANIDLNTLAIDCIDALDTPQDVAACWELVSEVNVIDPTCGSGAFLFAALSFLHLLYGAILDAAEVHQRTKPTEVVADILKEVDRHPNRDYFILKHATLNNLYGVDLMPEAVEIARLRMFLKLIAQIEEPDDIEPLPDLEFNFRSGNILVGAHDRNSITDKTEIANYNKLNEVFAQVDEAAARYRQFAAAQEYGDEQLVQETKVDLRETSSRLSTTLNQWWHAAERPESDRAEWIRVHKPFHWFAEFPGVFDEGGFDVVIGNPPYVGTTKIDYEYSGFRTDNARNIFSPCLERAAQICKADGHLAMIFPLSLAFSNIYSEARAVASQHFGSRWTSTYGIRPSSLFSGVQVRCTIVIGSPGDTGHHTTTHNIWTGDYRPHLFSTLHYARLPDPVADKRWYKVGQPELVDLLEAMLDGQRLGVLERKTGPQLWCKPVARYWMPVSFDAPPTYESDGTRDDDPNLRSMSLPDEESRDLAVISMAGKLGYFWWSINGDDLNVPGWIPKSFPAISLNDDIPREELLALAAELKRELQQPDTMIWNKNAGKWIGNYDLNACSHITRRSDELILEALGASHAREALQVWHSRVMKSTREATGSHRGHTPPIEAVPTGEGVEQNGRLAADKQSNYR